MEKLTKAQKNKKIKEEFRRIIEKYILDKEDIEKNSGQLKFMRGLLIRQIAITTNVRITNMDKRFTSKRIWDFFDQWILKDSDTNLSFVDFETNKEAYLQSDYGAFITHPAVWKESFGYPPFLLLTRIKSVMWRKLHDYCTKKTQTDQQECEDETALEQKTQAYLELLYSIALYEIFLIEYMGKLSELREKDHDQGKDAAKDKRLEQRVQQILQMDNKVIQKEELKKLTAEVNGYLDELNGRNYFAQTIEYFIDEINSLFAMLRVILLIEYMNINLSHERTRKLEEGRAHDEAIMWNGIVEEWWKEAELFLSRDYYVKGNRNYSLMYNVFNETFRRNSFIREKERTDAAEESNELRKYAIEIQNPHNDLKQYLDYVKNGYDENWTQVERKRIREVEYRLAIPIYMSLDELGNLQKEIISRKNN